MAPMVARVTPSRAVSADRVGAWPGVDQRQRRAGQRRHRRFHRLVPPLPSAYPCFVQLLNKIPVPPAAGQHATSRVRAAATAFFAFDGFIFATWAVRIPAVKAATGASPADAGHRAARGVGRRDLDDGAVRDALPPVRRRAGADLRGRLAVAGGAAARARPVRAGPRAGAGGVRHRVRLRQRGVEHHRGGRGRRAAPSGDAVVPRGVVPGRAGRGRGRRPAGAAPGAAAALRDRGRARPRGDRRGRTRPAHHRAARPGRAAPATTSRPRSGPRSGRRPWKQR